MALLDFSQFLSELEAPSQTLPVSIPQFTSIAGRFHDTWNISAPAGAVPTTAAAPTQATVAGPFLQVDGGTGVLGAFSADIGAPLPGVYILCDRLSHQGGLSGNNTGSQTTNLPTAALTRYTTGVGVMAMVSIYTQIGTASGTFSMTYTNQAGTGSRVSPVVVLGNTGFREASRAILVPLQSGDTGVRSIQSVITATASGTVGAFGMTLFKPLNAFILDDQTNFASMDFISGMWGGGMNEVVDGADLFFLCMSQGTVAGLTGDITLSEW